MGVSPDRLSLWGYRCCLAAHNRANSTPTAKAPSSQEHRERMARHL